MLILRLSGLTMYFPGPVPTRILLASVNHVCYDASADTNMTSRHGVLVMLILRLGGLTTNFAHGRDKRIYQFTFLKQR